MIVLAHGLEGSPEGRKARALRDAGFELVAPDGRGLPLATRVRALDEVTRGQHDLVLVGSSYGGLAALALVRAAPARFRGLVLCAPALVWTEEPEGDPEALVVPSGLPCLVLHGLRDTVIPIAASRRLVARSGSHVVLRELDDDHRLARSLDDLVGAVRQMCLA